jgi:hypothetical protein
VVSHCAALIGVAAKASTIRHGSVRTHLKVMLPGYAAGLSGMGWRAPSSLSSLDRAGAACYWGAEKVIDECESP